MYPSFFLWTVCPHNTDGCFTPLQNLSIVFGYVINQYLQTVSMLLIACTVFAELTSATESLTGSFKINHGMGATVSLWEIGILILLSVSICVYLLTCALSTYQWTHMYKYMHTLLGTV